MTTHYHLLGIGGIGMSALAHILREKGKKITGSDQNPLPLSLEKKGISLTSFLPKEGIVVYSSAIQKDHPLLVEAKKKNLLILHRSELLSSLLKEKKGLLVAGTHGKTTTSALLAWTLKVAGKEPTFAVGGILQNLQTNGASGEGEFFIAEADESDGSFLNYSGEGAIITNIEKEHLEYWKSEKNLVKGFDAFITSIKNKKLLFWCSDNPLLKELHPQGISYGKTGELRLFSCRQKGKTSIFSATFKGKNYDDIILPLMGEKLVLNALAVFGFSLILGIAEETIRKAFATFQGVKRRQEKIGEVNGITFYDDYAHHPTEIRALLEGLREGHENRRIIVLFQPHRYTRTVELFFDFKGVFEKADLTIITDIYSAGEAPIPGITAFTFFKEIRDNKIMYFPKEKLLNFLPKMLIPGDVLITMGAGDVTTFGPKILYEIS